MPIPSASVYWPNYLNESWKPITEKWDDIYYEFLQKVNGLIEQYGGQERISIEIGDEEGKPLQNRLFIKLR